jgi:hypothetical protein
MAAVNTPLPDLIELSGISSFTTYTPSGAGGGTILGVVDNATYSDGDPDNSPSNIAELNDTFSANGGLLTIDGTVYDIVLAVQNSFGDSVTINHDGGPTVLSGDHFASDIVFITATPQGGSAARYFAVVDDVFGNLTNITSLETRAIDFNPFGDDVKIDAETNNPVTVCFVEGTRILTRMGPWPVEELQPGDLIQTADNGLVPLVWRSTLEKRLSFDPSDDNHRPIRIAAGALGPMFPQHQLQVSPQHRMLLSSPLIEAAFGTSEILVPAVKLLRQDGITRRNQMTEVRYHHLYLGSHQVIFAEGAPTESFLPDTEARRSMPPASRLLTRHHPPARLIIEQPQRLNAVLEAHKTKGYPLVDWDQDQSAIAGRAWVWQATRKSA